MTSLSSVAAARTAPGATQTVVNTANDAAAADTGPVWFFLLADTAPGLLPRVMGQFAKRDLVPAHLHGTEGPDGLSLDLRVDRLDADTRRVLTGALRQIVGVRTVLTTDG